MSDPITRSEVQIGEDAVNALIAQSRTLTDMAPASVLSIFARGLFAPEMAQLYAAMLRQAEGFYVTTASGAALDRRLADFGLERGAVAAAFGAVRFSRLAGSAGNVVIPVGYRVGAFDLDGNTIEFTTEAQATIVGNDDFVDAQVVASQSGAQGNVGAQAITELLGGFVAGLGAVENIYAFTAGRDRDGDVAARGLFLDWLAARARCTAEALVYAVTTFEDPETGQLPVHSAVAIEHLDAPGPDGAAVTLYVWPHDPGILDVGDHGDSLLAALKRRIDGYVADDGSEVEGWRAAGVKVHITWASELEFAIRVRLLLGTSGSAQTRERLRRAILALFAGLRVGDPYRRRDIIELALQLGGEVEDVVVEEPGADFFVPQRFEKLVARAVDVL